MKDTLTQLGLLVGQGPVGGRLAQLCHEERLAGGVSISRRATPDEALGPLLRAIGGPALRLRLVDVRTTRPMVLELTGEGGREAWAVEDVEALVERLNAHFEDEPDARVLVALGPWESMLQVWAVHESALPVLLGRGLLDEASNLEALRERVAEDEW